MSNDQPLDPWRLRAHPVAEAFPLMEGEEFLRLVESIGEDGLQENIVLSPNGEVVIDGRNRLRGCKDAGVEPRFRRLPESYTESQIVGYIVNANLVRRHLTVGQKAMIATDIAEHLTQLAKQRQRMAGQQYGQNHPKSELPVDPPEALDRHQNESAVEAGKAIGVGEKSVRQAKKLRTEAPDLASKVQTGDMTLNSAIRTFDLRNKVAGAVAPRFVGDLQVKVVAEDGTTTSLSTEQIVVDALTNAAEDVRHLEERRSKVLHSISAAQHEADLRRKEAIAAAVGLGMPKVRVAGLAEVTVGEVGRIWARIGTTGVDTSSPAPTCPAEPSEPTISAEREPQ